MTPRALLPAICVTVICVTAAGCDRAESPTSPSSTDTSSTTTTVAEPTVTEEFAGTVAVGSQSFYSFTVETNGTVYVTFVSVGGAGVPTTAWLGLGIGVPSAEDCATTTTINGPPGSAAQITGTYAPGVYCVRISDIGNLFAPAKFVITIAHP